MNEQTALTVMHTIWMREHNRIADELQQLNSQWDREEVFQTARKIVGAEIQKITYKDYLPLLLGQSVFNELIGNYTGYNAAINPGVPNGFSTAAYRFGHSQIRPTFDRLNENYDPIDAGPLNLVDAFFNPSQYAASGGTDPILRGLVSNSARRIDEFLNDVLTNHLFQARVPPAGLDLASLNIQRGRDHGLPPYMIWKRWAQRTCGVSSNFENQLTFIRLLQTYGSLETVDLWVGGLAEERLPGSLVGATFACIIANAFAALRDGDRFYYENTDQTALFSAEQRVEIEKTSLSRIICDNADNIQKIQPNAFRLDQQRVNCSNIPAVNLSAWKATDLPTFCSIKLDFSGQSTITAYSRLFPSRSRKIYYVRRRVSRMPRSFCLHFKCPETGGSSSQLAIFSSRRCSVTRNSRLPSFKSMYGGIFFNRLDENDISAASGIYTDTNSCRSGSESALKYSCRVEQQKSESDLVHKLEEAVARQNSEENGGEDIELNITISDPRILDSARKLFENSEGKKSHVENTSNKNILIDMLENYLRKLKNNSKTSKLVTPPRNLDEKSDAQLISELEQALGQVS